MTKVEVDKQARELREERKIQEKREIRQFEVPVYGFSTARPAGMRVIRPMAGPVHFEWAGQLRGRGSLPAARNSAKPYDYVS